MATYLNNRATERIGLQAAFPSHKNSNGMSYREWLIGQALAGCLSGRAFDKFDADACARHAINLVDFTIARLATEDEDATT